MRDMTSGRPMGHLWKYALPILLGNWLQLAYNAADSIIAGRFIGKRALAAEGVAGPVMNLVILVITGMCLGAGVLMSEYFGAKDMKKYRETLGTVLAFGVSFSLVLIVLCVAFTPLMLTALSVPEGIFDITVTYLRITFLGAVFTFIYNALAAGLKSVGDSKTPLYFLAFSAVLNAVLDIIFLGVFRLGIVCSAVTTVVAEAVSAALALRYMSARLPEFLPQGEERRFNPAHFRNIFKYGAPTALQQAILPIGKLVISGKVNSLGVDVIAAFNAVTRVDDFACIPEQGLGAAIATFIAQNRGAKRYDRIRPGFRAGIALELGYWALIGLVTFFFREPIVAAFVDGEGSEAVVSIGAGYLVWMALYYGFPALTNGFQGFYRGMGKMFTTVIGTTLHITVRAVLVYAFADAAGLPAIAHASAVGWTVMLLFEIPYYHYTVRRL